jgi:LPXTG-site transpeptidase (sortase) family protein
MVFCMSAQRFRITDSSHLEPWKLMTSFLGVFFFSFLFLEMIGFVPENKTSLTQSSETPDVTLSGGTVTETPTASAVQSAAVSYAESQDAENPTRIIIEKVNIDMAIKNPVSTNIAVLDQALLSGAVRYPGSAVFGEDATMFLFGHSSYLPVVHNKAFRAFNDIQNLVAGDLIRVQSAQKEYVYRVTTVEKENLAEARVALERGERKLILATCDSFGKTSDRFIVTAVFVAEYPR